MTQLSQLTAPVLTDLYHAEHRGKSLAIATFLPYIGPALGPIIGGVVAQHIQWEWLFWILSIFVSVVATVGFLVLPETYTPVLLQRKAKFEKRSCGRDNSYQSFVSRLRVGLVRPIHLLVHRRIVQCIALVMGVNFGIYCLMLSTFADIWIDSYSESKTVSSLNYIAIAIGTTAGTQAGGHTMDWIYRHLRRRQPDAAPAPEYRVPFLVPGAILPPVGLFWYGWSAQAKLSWVMVDVGTAIFTCGSFILTQGMLAYLFDEVEHAASANAAGRLLSMVLGFAFPIFGPQMYHNLSYGWGNSLLAFLFLILAAPLPLILWVWGAELRAIGRHS